MFYGSIGGEGCDYNGLSCEQMGVNSSLVAKQLSVLPMSLEKRIIPRALFAQELLSCGYLTHQARSSSRRLLTVM
ncbi:hypothetical protein QQP08_014917 [Theobroma cacao]|nr:hypothetical protein QQP08_014917 [Theobroma cacao]